MADPAVVAQVKARLGITDATDDGLIGELLDQVTDYLEERTGRKLAPEAATSYVFDTAAGSELVVPRGIRTVTTLGIASGDQPDDGTGTYVNVAAADVLLRPSPAERRPGWPATTILVRGSGILRFSNALNGAKVLGDWGFASFPLGLAAVRIDAAVAAYLGRQGASGVVGADAAAVPPWDAFFDESTPQGRTVRRFAGGFGFA